MVYISVEGLFSLLYSCESNLTISELILSNGLLSNFMAFSVVVFWPGQEMISPLPKTTLLPSDKSNTILIKQNGVTHQIRTHDIIKLEADNNAVNIYTLDKRFVQYGRLKDWEVKLKASGIVRVHRSFIVNKAYIQTFQSKPGGDGILTLAGGNKVKVSRNYRSNVYMNGQLLSTI